MTGVDRIDQIRPRYVREFVRLIKYNAVLNAQVERRTLKKAWAKLLRIEKSREHGR